MTLLVAALVFIFGTTIGSFLSVIIYRMHTNKKGMLFSRSICPHCKKKLKASHLIPILSYILLRGKCGFCGKSISSHYLIIELISGLLFLATFLTFNFINVIPSLVDPSILNYTIDYQMLELFIFYIVEFTFLLAILFYDLFYKIIPDRFSVPAIIIAVIGSLLLSTVPPLDMAIGAAALGGFFLLQYVISKGKWVGGGDIRMGLLIGALLGWKHGVLAIMIAYILGALISLVLMAQKKASRKTELAFGPFLIIGTLTALFFGERLISWYLNTITFY